jgi:hypothetical protein
MLMLWAVNYLSPEAALTIYSATESACGTQTMQMGEERVLQLKHGIQLGNHGDQ